MELDGLYQEYAKMIYHFIYLKCNDKDLAEDIVQTTFLKAISQIDSFHGECKISTWLCQIAKNEYLNYCRKHYRQQSYDEYIDNNGEQSFEQEPYFRDVMLEKMILNEQTGIIKKILATLKEPYKEVFMLRVYGEYSFGEIAELFQKNDTWARVTYYRAKEKIIEGLKKKEEWDKSITPLKKVRKKIRRKNILIAVCVSCLLLFAGVTSLLTYGQITKKGFSFELLYDAVRFPYIGREFASGNIEPLYELLANGYLLQDAESSVLRVAYTDSNTYDEEMKEAILKKYHQYFDGKELTYKGIEEISYVETPKMGGNRTLHISLKFVGEDYIEYYMGLYKTLNEQYLIDDYFGNPYLNYTSGEGNEEQIAESAETYHTEDTLFSCLSNTLYDFDLYMMRHMILVSGQRALQGDTVLIEDGQMRLSIISEQDLADGTYNLRDEVNAKLGQLAEEEYYLTDITWNVKQYDKVYKRYIYQLNIELTNKTSLDEMIVSLDCYRVADKFVYISGTDKFYGNNFYF